MFELNSSKTSSLPLEAEEELNLTDFLTENARPDIMRLLNIAKELSRFMAQFGTPPDYQPPDTADNFSEIQLNKEEIKTLGAKSLDDFFALARTAGKPNHEPEVFGLSQAFPQGPNSLKPALLYTNQTIKALEAENRLLVETGFANITPQERSAKHRKMQQDKSALIENKAALIRAEQLWERLKTLLSIWIEEAQNKTKKAENLAQTSTIALKQIQNNNSDTNDLEDYEQPLQSDSTLSLTENATILAKLNQETQEQLFEQNILNQKTEDLAQELEGYLAVVSTDTCQLSADWTQLITELNTRLDNLEKNGQLLSESTPKLRRELSTALNQLRQSEQNLHPNLYKIDSLELLENVCMGVEALWKSIIEFRRETALLYFEIPPLIGNPLFLTQTYKKIALALGKGQNLLEAAKSQVGTLADRRSSTRSLRVTVKHHLLSLSLPNSNEENIKRLRHRLKALENEIFKALNPEEKKQTTAGLTALGAEKDRVKEDLKLAQLKLSDLGRLKASLIKDFQEKFNTLNQLNGSQGNFQNTQQKYQEGLKRLGRKHRNLLEKYNASQNKLIEVNAKFKSHQSELQQDQALLADLALEKNKALANIGLIKDELQEITLGRNEIHNTLSQIKNELQFLAAEKESLSAELTRSREELKLASKKREEMTLTITSYRKKLEKISTAYRRLAKKHHQQKKENIALSEKNIHLAEKNLRHEDSLIKMATLRQTMLSELGTAKIRVDALSKEKDNLLVQLNEAGNNAPKENWQNENAINSLIQIFGFALWRNQTKLDRLQKQTIQTLENFKMSAAAKEADLRIKAAAKEITLEQNWQEKENKFKKTIANHNEKISLLKQEKAAELEAQSKVYNRTTHALSLALAGINYKAYKRDQALRFLKQKNDTKIQTLKEEKEAILGLNQRQSAEIKDQQELLNQLAPVLSYFLEQAATIWAPPKKMMFTSSIINNPKEEDIWLVLIHFLRIENQMLNEKLDSSEDQIQKLKATQIETEINQQKMNEHLNQLEPVMAYMAQTFINNVAELAIARSQRETIKQHLNDFKKMHEGAKLRINQLNNQIEKINTDLNLAQNLLQTEQGRFSDLNLQYQEQDRVLEQTQNALKVANDKLITAQEQLQTEKIKFENLSLDYQSKNELLSQVQKQLVETSEELINSRNYLQKLQNNFEQLNIQQQQQQNHLNESQAKFTASSQELLLSEEKLKEQSQILEQARKEQSLLQQNQAETLESLEINKNKLSEKNTLLNNINQHVIALKQELNESQNNYQDLKTEHLNQSQILEQAQKEQSLLQQNQAETLESLEINKNKLSEKNTLLNNINQHVIALKQELNESQNNYQTLKTEHLNQSQILEQAQKEQSLLQHNQAETLESLEINKNKLSEKNTLLNNINQHVIALKQELNESQNNYQTLKTEHLNQSQILEQAQKEQSLLQHNQAETLESLEINKNKLSEKNTLLNNINQHVIALKQELNESQNNYQDLKTEHLNQSQILEQARKEQSLLQHNQAETLESLEINKNKLSEKNTLLNNINQHVIALKQELNESQNNYQTLKTEHLNQSQILEQARKEQSLLQHNQAETLESLKINKNKLSEKNTLLENINQHVIALKQELNESQNNYQTLKTEHLNQSQILEQARKEQSLLQQNQAETLESLEINKNKLSEKNTLLENVNQHVIALKQELNESQNNYQTLKTEHLNQSQILEQAQSDLRLTSSQLLKAKSILNEVQNNYQNLTLQYKEQNLILDLTQNELAETNDKLDKSKEKLSLTENNLAQTEHHYQALTVQKQNQNIILEQSQNNLKKTSEELYKNKQLYADLFTEQQNQNTALLESKEILHDTSNQLTITTNKLQNTKDKLKQKTTLYDDLFTEHNQQNSILLQTQKDLQNTSNQLLKNREKLKNTAINLGKNKKIYKNLSTEQEKQTEILNQTKAELIHLSESRSVLAQTLKNKQADLAEITEQAFRLSQEREQLKKQISVKEQEVLNLHHHHHNLTEEHKYQTGRLESSWAALNYIGAKSDDAVSRIKARMDAQGGILDDLRSRLEEKENEVKNLEKTQDRLALLYWTFLSQGQDLNWNEVLKEAKKLDHNSAEQKRFKIESNNKRSGSLRLDWKEFSKSAKKAARRGIIAMLLAGGLVLSQPQSAKVSAGLPKSGPGTLADLIKSAPTDPTKIASRLDSTSVGRPFDLSFLPPWERAKGFEHIQKRITEEVELRAQDWELNSNEYVSLIKLTYGSEDVVNIDDLNSDNIGYALLTSHFPGLTKEAIKQTPEKRLNKSELSKLLKFASSTEPAEGRYWDRLLIDFNQLSNNEVTNLNLLLNNYQKHKNGKVNLINPEFGGRLAPIAELENMSLDEFSNFIIPFIKHNLRNFKIEPGFMLPGDVDTLPIDQYAQRMAEDIYFSARLFKVPLTFMVTIAHQETHFANILGDRNRSASPFQIYQPTKPIIVKYLQKKGLKIPSSPPQLEKTLTLATYMAAAHMSDLIDRASNSWSKNKVALCDLDRVALYYNGGSAYPGAAYQKKLILLSHFNRHQSKQKIATVTSEI